MNRDYVWMIWRYCRTLHYFGISNFSYNKYIPYNIDLYAWYILYKSITLQYMQQYHDCRLYFQSYLFHLFVGSTTQSQYQLLEEAGHTALPMALGGSSGGCHSWGWRGWGKEISWMVVLHASLVNHERSPSQDFAWFSWNFILNSSSMFNETIL